MKYIALLSLLSVIMLTSCNDIKVGYLKAENAEYLPDSLNIEVAPAVTPRFEVWMGPKIQGVLGTSPIIYTVESVASENGSAIDASYFQSKLNILGDGRMYYPVYTDTTVVGTDTTFTNGTTVGKYVVSVRISNPGYSTVLNDAFTFNVK